MKELKERMSNLLDEVAGGYSSETRSFQGSNCLYDDGEGHSCAIGRLLPKKHKEFTKSRGLNTVDVETLFFEFEKRQGVKIPKVFEGLSMNFLITLQRLHDESDYWTKKGLSKEGEGEVETVKGLISGGFYE